MSEVQPPLPSKAKTVTAARVTGELSAVEDEKFADDIVDHDRRNDVGGKGIGGEDTETADQPSHNSRADGGADRRSSVKKGNLDDDIVPAGGKNPQHIGNIGDHAGKNKGDSVTDHRITGPTVIVDLPDSQFEQANGMVLRP